MIMGWVTAVGWAGIGGFGDCTYAYLQISQSPLSLLISIGKNDIFPASQLILNATDNDVQMMRFINKI